VFAYLGLKALLLFLFSMAACDVPGIKRLLPSEWREWDLFDNIYKLVGVPVVTVQLRYNGWVTELKDFQKSR
jgi:zeta-carotene desaturase